MGFGLFFVFISPACPDPLALGVGAFTPWLILRLVGTPTMPAAIAYYLLSQWLQVFARAFLALVDGEPMANSIYGPWVADAYWYMLASTVTLAFACKVVLGGIKPPTEQNWSAHLYWRPVDVFIVYLGSNVITQFASLTFGGALFSSSMPSLDFKIMAAFLLFTSVMSVSRGWPFLFAVLGIEILSGMTGLLGDFRGVFRVPWHRRAGRADQMDGTHHWLCGAGNLRPGVPRPLLDLGESRVSRHRHRWIGIAGVPVVIVGPRGYMVGRILGVGDIDWGAASKALLERLAYVDITGLVINVDLASAEQGKMRQWGDAVSHVFQHASFSPTRRRSRTPRSSFA